MNETIADRSSGSPSMSYMTASKAPMRSSLGCMALILDQRSAVRVGFAAAALQRVPGAKTGYEPLYERSVRAVVAAVQRSA